MIDSINVLHIANRALEAVVTDTTVEESTGVPFHGNSPIETILPGMTLDQIEWSQDRGNWTWDGVLIALRAMGVDTAQPLPFD